MPIPRPSDEWAGFVAGFSERLRDLRLRAGLTQEDVAYAAGVSRATYQRYEGVGRAGMIANPDLRYIIAIAQALDVTLDELFPKPWPDFQTGRTRARGAA